MKQCQHVNTVWLHVRIDGMKHNNSIMWSWPMTATPSSKFLFGMNQLSIQFTVIYLFVFQHVSSLTQLYPDLPKTRKKLFGHENSVPNLQIYPWHQPHQLFPTFPNFFPTFRQMAWWTRVSPPRHRHSSRSSSRGSWRGHSAWRCHRSHLRREAPPHGGDGNGGDVMSRMEKLWVVSIVVSIVVWVVHW